MRQYYCINYIILKIEDSKLDYRFNKKSNGLLQLVTGTVVFIAFIINSNFLQNISTEATVVGASLRFLLSVILADVCYYFIKSEKLFNKSIKLSRMSKI